MSKKVLLVYYSQTGQLGDIVKHFASPFLENGVDVEIKRVETVEKFVFPWTGKRFLMLCLKVFWVFRHQ
ncbi:MAG: hypothetical protein WAQ28_16860 [Bacteroidia bacterium]|jgi:menaquinone-dependent protoporphyrinogen IX oxidase